MNFYILSLPRSGSHMLASALNSHPDISCEGEFDHPMYNWLGNKAKATLYGAIARPELEIHSQAKIIVLTRAAKDIVISSARRVGFFHYKKPTNEKGSLIQIREGLIEEQEQLGVLLLRKAQKYNHILVSYEEITNNKDIRQIPEEITNKICAFLGIRNYPLVPVFYKPLREIDKVEVIK